MPMVIVNDVELVAINDEKLAKSWNLVDDVNASEKPPNVKKKS